MSPDAFQEFLDDLVAWAETRPEVIGVVGLGSTAGTTHQPDEFSDHDVFILTTEGNAAALRDNFSWMPGSERIVMVSAETMHGRALLYDDGHLVEVAVFDDHELERARVNAYRVFVDRGGIAERLALMAERDRQKSSTNDPDGTVRFRDWVVQVVVAIGRDARGETLSANERVRGRAMTDLVSLLAANLPAERETSLDNLDPHRRFEFAYPTLGARLEEALESPLAQTVATMIDIVEEHIVGHIEAATPDILAAMRALIARATH